MPGAALSRVEDDLIDDLEAVAEPEDLVAIAQEAAIPVGPPAPELRRLGQQQIDRLFEPHDEALDGGDRGSRIGGLLFAQAGDEAAHVVNALLFEARTGGPRPAPPEGAGPAAERGL